MPKYLEILINIASQSTCSRSKCASIIVQGEEIIGRGYNSYPMNLISQRRCHIEKDSYDKKVTDKTCCVHAEQRAIMDALAHKPQNIKGSTLYFLRLSESGQPQASLDPYCTICSKMALDVGIGFFCLYSGDSWRQYGTEEYNNISYQYNKSNLMNIK